MSLFAPPKNWWRPVELEEKIWIGIALVWCLVMFVVMVVWAAVAKQNPPSETYRIAPEEFGRRTAEFAKKHQIKENGKLKFEKGIPVVQAPEDEDSYMLGKTWSWEPILVMKKGRKYRLRLSSVDYQHGFSLYPENLNLQVLPGYELVAEVKPKAAGEFLVICNEYCGFGHHEMVGKIIVTE